MQIYINRDGQQFGPFTIDQVNQGLASGQLLATDFAFHEGLAGWTQLSQIQGVILPGQPQQAIPAQLVSAGDPAVAEAEPIEAATAVTEPAVEATAAGSKKNLYLYIGIGVGVLVLGMSLWWFLSPPEESTSTEPKKKASPPPTPPQDESESIVSEYADAELPKSVAFGEIKLILDNNCAKCHEPDNNKVDTLLANLDTPEGLKGLEDAISNGTIKKFEPRQSEFMRRLFLEKDDSEFMPKKSDPLKDEEKKKLYKWILDGANLE